MPERTRMLTCARCGHDRWTSHPRPYTCQRCTDVLAGRPNVTDPKGLPGRPWTAQRRQEKGAGRGLEAPGHTEIASTPPESRLAP
jgi:hypothetical protein